MGVIIEVDNFENMAKTVEFTESQWFNDVKRYALKDTREKNAKFSTDKTNFKISYRSEAHIRRKKN